MKRVLIVDDEMLIRRGLSRALANAAREVKAAKTLGEAIAEIESSFYDLCLVDIHLDDGSGLDVLRRIRELSPRTKVAIVSGSIPEGAVKKEIEDSGCIFVSKPFDLVHIREVVEEALRSGIEETG